ncbi:MAG: hypothetical protein KIC56_05885 [Clostridium sp.]|nr:hypothetical protein [Clostridium sp.]
MEAKTVEYCFDSKVYSGEDIKRKIEQIKREFSRISNKPIEVRVELNELGIYVLTFIFYAKRNIAKVKPEKINKIYIESLGEYSDNYINKLIGNKDTKYINKLNDRSKEHKMLEKKLKEQAKKRKHAQIKYVKESENKEKIKNKVQKQENKENSNLRVPHIEYLKREEEKENFIEKLQEYLKMLKNVKLPKLERKNKIKNNKLEKKQTEYSYNKKNLREGEQHYWSNNYVPKEYGKYKATKTYKPL